MSLENNVRRGAAVDITSADKKYVGHDYRELRNRREGFILWYAWSVANGDCDPALWLMNYLNQRYEHNIEEKLWFAWLYHTYNLPTAWVYKQEFPDEELASVERFTDWNNENYSRLRYQVDTKWSKGHLPTMYESYQDWLRGRSQLSKFDAICSGSPEENFAKLWSIVKGSWYKFGRYTAFFYLQTLKHTCDIPLECPTLFLNDYSGSKSHRNGLCFVAGKDDWVNQKLTTAEYAWLEGFGADLLQDGKTRYPSLANQMDNFSLETCLCSYKKLFRTKKGRYMGYYLDRQSEEITQAEKDGWQGIDWKVLHQARKEVIGDLLAPEGALVDKQKMFLFHDSGTFHYHVR
jgi:hypothetical protein